MDGSSWLPDSKYGRSVGWILIVGSLLPNSWAQFVRSAVEKLLAVTFLPVIYLWLPQGYLSEFRVQTLDNPYCELIGYSIYLCHGRWTDCHISATSSQNSTSGRWSSGVSSIGDE